MTKNRSTGLRAIAAVVIFLGLAIFAVQLSTTKPVSNKQIKVLSYSSFLASWGPGPELAKMFSEQTGIEVVYQDADDAGLLLSKLELFPSDLVIGFDSITAFEAKAKQKWKAHGLKLQSSSSLQPVFDDPEFLAFDWSPLTFIYREDEIEPPLSIDDILHPRFKNQISLQDPRTSSPGLQFLFWLVALKGEDGAFEFLNQLKSNIRAISPSWSTAYGLFQNGEAKLAVSYLTSPVYHWMNENDRRYAAVSLKDKHIFQVELAAIPDSCVSCDGAKLFLEFLLSEPAQRIIMEKNVMLPISEAALLNDQKGFNNLPKVELLSMQQLELLFGRKKQLLQRWKDLKL